MLLAAWKIGAEEIQTRWKEKTISFSATNYSQTLQQEANKNKESWEV